MTKSDAQAISMLKRMLDFNKEHDELVADAMVLGFTLGIMTLIAPENMNDEVRDCISATYHACNKEIAPTYHVKDMLKYILDGE